MLTEEFEQMFNIIPFCIFGLLFITLPTIISGIKHDWINQKEDHLTYDAANYAMFHLITFTYILLMWLGACNSRRQVDKQRQQLMDQLQCISMAQGNRLQLQGIDTLLSCMRQEQSFKLTGLRMFTLNESLMISFAASIITFSVLLIQLQN